MKSGIHPEYRPVIFLDTSANHSFLTRSAIDTKGRETMKWTDGKEYPRGQDRGVLRIAPVLHRQDRRSSTPPAASRSSSAATPRRTERNLPGRSLAPAWNAAPPRRCRPRPRRWRLIALAFVLPGLAGHDPWKTHDAIGIGIAHDMATSGDAAGAAHRRHALAVRPAAVPLARRRPSAGCCSSSSSSMPRARLASGALVLGAFCLIYARRATGSPAEHEARQPAPAALLLLLGSLGLMVHAHEALPELAALAALCGALAALPHAARRPLAAGVLFGAALGFAFLVGELDRAARRSAWRCSPRTSCATEWRTRSGLIFAGVVPAGDAAGRRQLAAALSPARRPSVRALVDRSPRSRTAIGGNLRYFLGHRELVRLARPGRSRCGRSGRCAGARRAAPVRAVRRLGR